MRGVGGPVQIQKLMFCPPWPKFDCVIAQAISPVALFKKENAGLRGSRAFQLTAAPEAKLYGHSHIVVPGDVEGQFKGAAILSDRHALI